MPEIKTYTSTLRNVSWEILLFLLKKIRVSSYKKIIVFVKNILVLIDSENSNHATFCWISSSSSWYFCCVFFQLKNKLRLLLKVYLTYIKIWEKKREMNKMKKTSYPTVQVICRLVVLFYLFIFLYIHFFEV